MLTDEKINAYLMEYSNDEEQGAFERVVKKIWDDALESAAQTCEAIAEQPPMGVVQTAEECASVIREQAGQ